MNIYINIYILLKKRKKKKKENRTFLSPNHQTLWNFKPSFRRQRWWRKLFIINFGREIWQICNYLGFMAKGFIFYKHILINWWLDLIDVFNIWLLWIAFQIVCFCSLVPVLIHSRCERETWSNADLMTNFTRKHIYSIIQYIIGILLSHFNVKWL